MEVPSLHCSATALVYLFLATGVAATPALIGGFKRRGTGRIYENRFWIQRAPQMAVAVEICALYLSSRVLSSLSLAQGERAADWVERLRPSAALFSIAHLLPPTVATIVAWSGVLLAVYGSTLLLRGWYTLGENLSVDAELLHHQALCTSGPYRIVMHPVYAGIVHALGGAALALLSPLSALVALGAVAPLFARRAKYEEGLLTAAFGREYTDYGDRMGWHRFVPTFLSSAKR